MLDMVGKIPDLLDMNDDSADHARGQCHIFRWLNKHPNSK